MTKSCVKIGTHNWICQKEKKIHKRNESKLKNKKKWKTCNKKCDKKLYHLLTVINDKND